MRWKDILLGAAVTLLVTVVGGVIVYYVTREKPMPQEERLLYQVEQPTNFETDTAKRSFVTIRVANLGSAPAKAVGLVVEVPDPVAILDKKVTSSSDPASLREIVQENQHRLRVQAQTLLPDESETLVLMLDGALKEGLKVGVRSERSIGRESPLIKEVSKPSEQLLSALIPFLVLLQVPIALAMSTRAKAVLRRFFPTFANTNNTAFLYIHRGLITEAEELLAHTVVTRGADAVTLANYALALGLAGKSEQAGPLMDAAAWYASHRHEKAVVAFNQAILAFARNDYSAAKGFLRGALRHSKAEILRYSRFTVHLCDPVSRDAEVRSILELSDGHRTT